MTKIDNSNKESKLKLRRYFLNKYHLESPPHVIDCCQGSGVLWNVLKQEFDIGSYWGMDVKKKKGRLKVDSARVLSLSGWKADVIDIYTYGSPWKHWKAMLPNITQDMTVFLTIGQAQMGTDSVIYEALGIGGLNIPPGIGRPLQDISLSSLLTMGYDSGIIIGEAVEAPCGRHARYLGIRLTREIKS